MVLMMLLVDERPEEVTDMRRSVKGEVIASSNDKDVTSHIRTSRLAIEKAKRLVEYGKDVLLLLDSITRLARSFNQWVGTSGRTLSGGVDSRAMAEPKRIFGSARKIEHGGSLTIIATALIDTGSRMDQVIFEEFKGTGNMELTLDRKPAERRLWPAVNLEQSGTRKEELLIPPEDLKRITLVRKALAGMKPLEAIERLIGLLSKYPSNAAFLDSIPVSDR
jgi:transcription termination factor Rho